MEILLIFAVIGFIFKIMEKDEKGEKREAYYPNGKLLARAYFNKKGEINGIEERFYENEVIKAKIEWKNGKIEGIEKSYDEKCKLIGTITFENDQIMEETTYKDGKIIDRKVYPLGKDLENELLKSETP